MCLDVTVTCPLAESYVTGSARGLPPSRTKTRQNESPAERNPTGTTTRQKENPTERKAQFEPVYNKLCVGTVFAASGNVTTET